MNGQRFQPDYAHSRWLNTILGVTVCAIIATITAGLLNANSHKAAVPLVFLVVIALMAIRYGALAGILGSVVAALIFSYFLFSPVGSFRVEREAAKDNIGWMLLIGIPASYFLEFSRPAKTGKDANRR
jgi:K+-sensing histidine kinase KdpD